MWFYEGEPFEKTPEEFQGFVYRITDDCGKMYIGKKFFWKPKILPVTKTRKRRKRTIVESDWKTYHGSNELLKERVQEGGEVKREILRLCKTKGQCSYYEAKLQFENDVLLDDNYYNNFIGCKIHSKHLIEK